MRSADICLVPEESVFDCLGTDNVICPAPTTDIYLVSYVIVV